MAESPGSSLEQFHPLVAQWFTDTFGSPTPVQTAAWESIAGGSHCLITAPTGTGKTLSAFLTALDRLIRGSSGRVLYISPLKALNYDIERNLNRPLQELRHRFAKAGEPFPEIRVGVRSGDTEQSERRRLITHPPEILVTTPESLNLMLSSRNGLRGLEGFNTVILDEIHAVLSSKRGTYLMSGVERLVSICGEFQRVGLSATVRPMPRAAEILGGYARDGESYEPRPVDLVEVESQKQYELTIRHPNSGDQQAGTLEAREEWWRAITRCLRKQISENRSTLIFANSRRMVEKLARMLNEEEGEPVYAHHGSLSREVRRVVEERLKAGELRAIVATSSLELGIDVGEIDEVILVQAPFSIASAVQRIGRAGHGVGAISRGSFLPIHSRDLLESAALTRAITEGAVEEINPPERPLDVLAQVILSMAVVGPVELEEVYRTVRSVHAYHHLRREELELVVEMLAGKYADSRIRELNPRISYDRGTGRIEARKNAAMLLYMSGGVIPDRGYYTLRLADSKAKIGELDEEFVWERSLGDAFPFGNRAWRITGITNNDVLVVPADASNSVVPFWRAEEQSRPFAYSSKIGAFLEETESILAGGDDLAGHLVEHAFMERSAASALEEYLQRQRMHTGSPLPHRHHLVIERYCDPKNSADALQVVIHTIWGSAVNKPLSLALSAAWRERYGFALEVYANNDAVLLNLPQEHSGEELFSLLQGVELPALLRNSIEGGGIFGARFRENAQRALLLPRKSFSERMPLWLNRLRSKKLLKATADREDFPITLETWRECMQNEFDVATLSELLADLETGRITYSEVETVTPSPFADSIIWRQTNFRMYQDDSAASELRTSLSDELLEEVLHSPHLRPEIPTELVADFERKLQRLAEGYAPETAAELLAWIEERLFIPSSEWEALLEAMERDGTSNAVELVDSIRDRLHFPPASQGSAETPIGVIAALNRRLYEAALAGESGEQEEEPATDRFLAQWLDYYGPVSLHRLRRLLPFPAEALDEAMDHLTGSGTLLLDRFTQGADAEELCSRENLERLLRMRRAEARPELEPLTAGEFQLFLARRQGVVEPGESLEALEHRLEQLFGYAARASLWESDILPARLDPYYPSWLDRAMGESDLRWIGCGNKRVAFAFESDLDLILEEPVENDDMSEAAARLESALRSGGGRSFLDLAKEAGLRTDEATEALWELVWNGVVTNDALQTLRQGVRTDFTPEGGAGAPGERNQGEQTRGEIPRRAALTRRRRGSYRRWSSTRPMGGTWFPMPAPQRPEDPLEEAELLKERVRLLLSRYGVLFRELLSRELPPMQWGRLFRTLRLMELSGEVTSGHFVDGVTGIQFISPSALRELSARGGEDRVYWLNAADPASLCGSELPGDLPSRLPTTHLVYQGAELVLVSRKSGKELTFRAPPGAPRMGEYLSLFSTLLSRQESPLRKVRAEKINGEVPRQSPYTDDLKRFGFVGDGPYLTLYRKY